MYTQVTAPKNRLDKNAIKVWLINETIANVVGLLIIGLLFYLNYLFDWPKWALWILIITVTILLLAALWFTFVQPFLRYKNYRYHVDADFIQLKSGAFIEKHQLVPMTKIQSVETNQGPILRKYGLYSLSIETIGSSHTIPALSEDIALHLRSQIAHFAKIKEV